MTIKAHFADPKDEHTGDKFNCSHDHSDRMVWLATKWLEEYFSDAKARRPGDLEDDFTGSFSLFQEPWHRCPFYPALGKLVQARKIVYGKAKNGDMWYAIPGHLPKGCK